MAKMCLNWKVIGGLAVVALGLLLVAPHLLLTALPLLLIAICPLSMLLMGKAMMGGGQKTPQQTDPAMSGAAHYTCPMHPDLVATGPGSCPKCGMNLVPTTPAETVAVPDRSPSALDPAEEIALLRLQLQRTAEQQAALARQLEHLQGTATTAAPSKDAAEAVQNAGSPASRV